MWDHAWPGWPYNGCPDTCHIYFSYIFAVVTH